jgi:hypothetical protein
MASKSSDYKRFKGNSGEFHRKILSLTAIDKLKDKFGIDCSLLPESYHVRFLFIKIFLLARFESS